MNKYMNRQSVIIVNFIITLIAGLLLTVFKDSSVNLPFLIIDAQGIRLLAVILWVLVSLLTLVYEIVVRMIIEKQKLDNLDMLAIWTPLIVILIGILYMAMPKV